MKKKKLILLTSEFPYGKGEPFLETEITYLADAFDEVLIYSSTSSSANRRAVPQNVRCEIFSTKTSPVDKLQALQGVFSSEYKQEKKRASEVYELEWTEGIRNTALMSLFFARKWKKRLKEQLSDTKNYDVVFYSYWCTDTALGLALLRKENPSIQAFSRVHGWDLYFEATAFNYQPFRGLIAENMSGLFPISDKGERYIRERWKVNSDSVKVLRLGTKAAPKNDHATDRNRLVSCSNMIPLKRVHLIAESLKQLKDIQLDWYHFGDGSERVQVEKAIDSIQGQDIEVTLFGHKDNQEVLNWYHKNRPNVFINVSETEGIPVSMMEAMSFGIPCIGTNVGGVSEIIVDGVNGFLLPANPSIQEVYEAIDRYFKLSPDEQQTMRANAHSTWESRCNAAENYRSFASLLAEN